ncbi:hypothetical protein J3R30DRAFT_1122144 [Lentinula aciculospora]|uniref:WW domain-containing protein n=1 Tax=Lentinula aciculospora TaxID=153920 RepID=A0A9W9A1H1_9AGAR|nr:hypothetical protein J3R30DRAFT_1122144 [Lentinula aciculospora]
MTGWEIRLPNSRGIPFFFNTETKESTWNCPPGITREELKELPGPNLSLSRLQEFPVGQIRVSHLLVKHSGSRRPSTGRRLILLAPRTKLSKC